MAKKVVVRKYSVDYYLRSTDHPNAIKKMMSQLFRGRVETMERWTEIDNNVNKREVR